ncbi:MAG TPA: hypothetical protein VFJ58_19135 [Armatimonadota bacterium]|nr:hypothetical protein [Armatimonadota bacterium]
MNKPVVRVLTIGAAILAVTASLAWAAVNGTRLYYNGKVVSTRVIMHNGEAYAPIRDVAAAFALSVQPRADGYTLIQPGGGNQIEGVNGKIGQQLSNGPFLLTVVSVDRVDDYKRRLTTGGDVIPAAGQDVVAVTIRLKNATPKRQDVMVFGNPVSLTDQDEHGYDLYYGDSPARNVSMLPGSAVDAVLTFLVPKTAVLKDLVYKVDCLPVSGQVFRVSLKKPE